MLALIIAMTMPLGRQGVRLKRVFARQSLLLYTLWEEALELKISERLLCDPIVPLGTLRWMSMKRFLELEGNGMAFGAFKSL